MCRCKEQFGCRDRQTDRQTDRTWSPSSLPTVCDANLLAVNEDPGQIQCRGSELSPVAALVIADDCGAKPLGGLPRVGDESSNQAFHLCRGGGQDTHIHTVVFYHHFRASNHYILILQYLY